MGFRVKTFVQIVGDMVSHMRASQRRVTDFNVGSVNRTLLEASAAEIDELYQAYAQGLIEAIPVALYRGFDFDLRAATAASGLVRFRATPDHEAPVVIPVGFLVAAGPLQFQVAAQAVIPVGQQEADALVVCATDGAAGNVQPGAIASLVGTIQDLAGVTNPSAFGNGRTVESNEERKLRFIRYVKTLARGTPEACVYAARLASLDDAATGRVLERAARCEIEETPGHVDMWIHNGVGGTSDALLARAADLVHGGWTDPQTGEELIPGYDPTGMRVDVQKMAEIPVPVSIRIQAPASARTEALKNRVRGALSTTIRASRSNSVLLPIELLNAGLALRAPVTGAQIDAPLAAVSCPKSAALVPGPIAVDWM